MELKKKIFIGIGIIMIIIITLLIIMIIQGKAIGNAIGSTAVNKKCDGSCVYKNPFNAMIETTACVKDASSRNCYCEDTYEEVFELSEVTGNCLKRPSNTVCDGSCIYSDEKGGIIGDPIPCKKNSEGNCFCEDTYNGYSLFEATGNCQRNTVTICPGKCIYKCPTGDIEQNCIKSGEECVCSSTNLDGCSLSVAIAPCIAR